jgi:uncharacterized protein with FMN-binding domain
VYAAVSGQGVWGGSHVNWLGVVRRAFGLSLTQSGSRKKVANSLVAASSAAVLAVYAAGYARTWSAANRLDAQAAERRPALSYTPPTAPPVAELRPAAPNPPVAPASPKPAPEAAGKPLLIASAEPVPTTAEVPSDAPAPAPAETPAPAVEPVAAPAPVAPAPAPPAPAAPRWKDGTYYGWGTSRHGNIQAEVVIEAGRIASAAIAQCWTRYPCSVIAHLPPQVALRQSPEVDYVSRATESVNAFYYGVVEALGKAK